MTLVNRLVVIRRTIYFYLFFSMQAAVVLVFSNTNVLIMKLEVLKVIAISSTLCFGMIRLLGFCIEDFYADYALNFHIYRFQIS